MRMTIQRRLTILSAISLLGLSMLFALYFSTLSEVESISTKIENIIKERRDIMQGRFANKGLSLVAMDVLVDKESRSFGKWRDGVTHCLSFCKHWYTSFAAGYSFPRINIRRPNIC